MLASRWYARVRRSSVHDVAVVVRAAASARPEPVGQREVAIDATADAAGFRGRIETVRAHDPRPVPFGLVFAKSPEHTPSAVRYTLREFVIREHSADV